MQNPCSLVTIDDDRLAVRRGTGSGRNYDVGNLGISQAELEVDSCEGREQE